MILFTVFAVLLSCCW